MVMMMVLMTIVVVVVIGRTSGGWNGTVECLDIPVGRLQYLATALAVCGQD